MVSYRIGKKTEKVDAGKGNLWNFIAAELSDIEPTFKVCKNRIGVTHKILYSLFDGGSPSCRCILGHNGRISLRRIQDCFSACRLEPDFCVAFYGRQWPGIGADFRRALKRSPAAVTTGPAWAGGRTDRDNGTFCNTSLYPLYLTASAYYINCCIIAIFMVLYKL